MSDFPATFSTVRLSFLCDPMKAERAGCLLDSYCILKQDFSRPPSVSRPCSSSTTIALLPCLALIYSSTLPNRICFPSFAPHPHHNDNHEPLTLPHHISSLCCCVAESGHGDFKYCVAVRYYYAVWLLDGKGVCCVGVKHVCMLWNAVLLYESLSWCCSTVRGWNVPSLCLFLHRCCWCLERGVIHHLWFVGRE